MVFLVKVLVKDTAGTIFVEGHSRSLNGAPGPWPLEDSLGKCLPSASVWSSHLLPVARMNKRQAGFPWGASKKQVVRYRVVLHSASKTFHLSFPGNPETFERVISQDDAVSDQTWLSRC